MRQALLRGFDRAAVSTAQFSRHAQPAALPVSPASPSTTRRWPRRWTTPPRPWSRSSPLPAIPEPTGYGRRRGDRWRLTFVAPNNNADRLAAAETLAANLTDAGLRWSCGPWPGTITFGPDGGGVRPGTWGEVRLTADFDPPPSLTSAAPSTTASTATRGAEPPQRLPRRRGTVADGAGLAAL